jgi:hypothetical protein
LAAQAAVAVAVAMAVQQARQEQPTRAEAAVRVDLIRQALWVAAQQAAPASSS